MKNLIIIILFITSLLSCKDKVTSDVNLKNKVSLDSLFSKSVYSKLNDKEKVIYLKTLSNILKTSKNDSLTRFYYFKLAGRYFNLNDYDNYYKQSKNVLLLSQESSDNLHIAKSYQFLGDYFFRSFQNDSAFYYYTKSEKTFLKSNKKHSIADIQISKAKILYYEKDFAGCEAATIEILKKAIATNNYRLKYECYLTLGNALDGLNNSQKAIEYYIKAYNLKDNLKNEQQYLLLLAQPYVFIGVNLIKEKQYQNAAYYLEKGLKLANFKNSEPLLYANLINNLGYAKLMLGDKKAVKLIEESLEIQSQLNNTPGIVESKINLAAYYLQIKDSAQALIFINQAKITSHSNKMFEDEIKAFNMLSEIDPIRSQDYRERIIILSDSLQTVERATRNKFARIEFETNEIISEKKLVENKNQVLARQILWIIGISFLIIIFISILYWSRRQHSRNKELRFEQEQQKANQAIYQLMLDQQTKLDEGRKLEKQRISQELHDGIMSKLTSVRLNLFVLNKKNDPETIKKCLEHVAEIQNIEKEIRAISHDLQKDIFANKNSYVVMINGLFENHKTIYKTDYQLIISEKIIWEKIDSNIKMNIYRVFQESLQNIAKYANATKIELQIEFLQDIIQIKITDNGNGFDKKKNVEGIGLKNMKSRIASIGGTFIINSIEKFGTTIILEIPN